MTGARRREGADSLAPAAAPPGLLARVAAAAERDIGAGVRAFHDLSSPDLAPAPKARETTSLAPSAPGVGGERGGVAAAPGSSSEEVAGLEPVPEKCGRFSDKNRLKIKGIEHFR